MHQDITPKRRCLTMLQSSQTCTSRKACVTALSGMPECIFTPMETDHALHDKLRIWVRRATSNGSGSWNIVPSIDLGLWHCFCMCGYLKSVAFSFQPHATQQGIEVASSLRKLCISCWFARCAVPDELGCHVFRYLSCHEDFREGCCEVPLYLGEHLPNICLPLFCLLLSWSSARFSVCPPTTSQTLEEDPKEFRRLEISSCLKRKPPKSF